MESNHNFEETTANFEEMSANLKKMTAYLTLLVDSGYKKYIGARAERKAGRLLNLRDCRLEAYCSKDSGENPLAPVIDRAVMRESSTRKSGPIWPSQTLWCRGRQKTANRFTPWP